MSDTADEVVVLALLSLVGEVLAFGVLFMGRQGKRRCLARGQCFTGVTYSFEVVRVSIGALRVARKPSWAAVCSRRKFENGTCSSTPPGGPDM